MFFGSGLRTTIAPIDDHAEIAALRDEVRQLRDRVVALEMWASRV